MQCMAIQVAYFYITQRYLDVENFLRLDLSFLF